MGRRFFLALVPLLLLAAMVSPALSATSDDSGDGTVGVSINRVCQVEQNQLDPPGTEAFTVNGTDLFLNVLGVNETDSFFFDFYNTGNRNATVTVNLTVTNETEYWEPGEPKGNFINLTKQEELVNESYDPFTVQTTYYIPPGETAIGNTYYLITKFFEAKYPAGFYTGRLNVNYSCPNLNYSKNISDHANFMLVESEILTAGGEGNITGGKKGDIPTDTPFPALANYTGNLTTNTTAPRRANKSGNYTSNITRAEGISDEGNYSTNQTAYRNVNETGLEANQTVPADANRTGEESDQFLDREANRTGGNGTTVPGDNDQPGETPDPRPRLQIDIEPFRDEYPATQGQYAPVALQVQNLGERTIEDFQVAPSIGELRQGWQVQSADISSIGPGENITREVFVRPPGDAEPGRYVSPVVAGNGTARFDLDYFTVKITEPPEFSSRISIQESPSSVSMESNSSRRIPVLVTNNGDKPLTDVTARLQNAEDCAVTEASTVDRIEVNESASLSVKVETAEGSSECDSQLIVSSSEGAYAFNDVRFSTRPEEGLIPRKQRVPFLAIAWTLLLAVYAVIKKRYQLESGLVKAPFVLLLTGESVIILYLLVNYYGIMSVAFLPF
jgi:hypothetical protein